MKRFSEARERAVTLAVVLLVGTVFGSQSSAAAPRETKTNYFNELIACDPHYGTNLARMASIADLAGQKKGPKGAKKLARETDDLKDLPTAELQKRFAEKSPRYESRAIATVGRLAKEALDNPGRRDAYVADILEVQAAMRNELLPLVPDKLGFFSTWIFFFKNMGGTIGRGDTVATNIAVPTGSASDGGRNDPPSSIFWQRPAKISGEDLYAGFGRKEFPHLENFLCEYSGPKTSSGTHAGFDVECNGVRYKIKFGEENSEPFTARIFYALGYYVDPTDYAPYIKVRYDRRLFREFHLRQPLNMRITPLGIQVGTIHLQQHYDPFAFITRAVFKDGREVSAEALKQMLFIDTKRAHPEDSPANFRPQIEASLDYLVTAAANVQLREEPTESIGAWDFSGLGHGNLRELRGAGLLAAWLAFFDSRIDNTKLRIVRDAEEVQLRHFIADLGGGMGAGTGFFSPHGENPNDFAWTFTAPEIIRGPGRMTTPFRIEHFKPTVPTPAFAAMTTDDARWMARLIGQLTEDQLRAALIGSGYDNAAARLYLEKLISRRDQMIRDLKLETEIPLLRPTAPDRTFSYHPSLDGPFETVMNGSTLSARHSSAIIVRGKIIQQ
jgi:hypothetical protein